MSKYSLVRVGITDALRALREIPKESHRPENAQIKLNLEQAYLWLNESEDRYLQDDQ